MKTKRTRKPIRVSEAAMAALDWEERLKSAARTFTADESVDTLSELKVAGYWQRELEKAKKREGRP